jgi:hypothetical protein
MSRKNGRRVFSDKDGTKIGEDIADIKEEAKLWIVNFLLSAKEALGDILVISDELTAKLKELVQNFEGLEFDNGLFDFLVKSTAWEGDDQLLAWLRNGGLEKVIGEITGYVIEGEVTLDKIIAELLQFIFSLTEFMQEKTISAFNSALAYHYYNTAIESPEEISQSEFDLSVQAFYTERKFSAV